MIVLDTVCPHYVSKSMNEQASASEIQSLRDRIAVLEKTQAHPLAAPGMEGFRQLGEAIEQNRLQSFLSEKG